MVEATRRPEEVEAAPSRVLGAVGLTTWSATALPEMVDRLAEEMAGEEAASLAPEGVLRSVERTSRSSSR